MTDKKVWVLADDRAGNVAQALGVAEALGEEIEIKNIRYTKWVALPNFLRGASLIGVTEETAKELSAPWPDYVISAGRRSAPVARWIKKQSQGKTKIIHMMYPGYFGLSDFDLVVLPYHDGCRLDRENIMRVIGAPHRVTPEKLAAEKEKWAPVFERLPRPMIAVIVGGATKDKPFTVNMAKDFAAKVKKMGENLGGASFLVTTSRRTGRAQEQAIKDGLCEPMFFYEWGNKEMDNPYFGFLASADHIVVTGDSVSMCSEACATEVPVYIYAPKGSVGKKHALLHQELYEKGLAHPLDGGIVSEKHPRLMVAKTVAERIKSLG